jgi:hypothetical protein
MTVSRTRCLLVLVSALLLLASCRERTPESFTQRLPELPQDIAATLDEKTMATRAVASFGTPEPLPGTPAAPCCASAETRQLTVSFPYTKCGPLRDLIVANFSDLVLSRGEPGGGTPRMHKLTTFQGRTLPIVHLCMSSNGPWDAVLTETRACSPYTPVYQLAITAFGDVVVFNWSGSQSPPSNVQIASCRILGTVRTPCGISNCECPSSSCLGDAACQCPLDWP